MFHKDTHHYFAYDDDDNIMPSYFRGFYNYYDNLETHPLSKVLADPKMSKHWVFCVSARYIYDQANMPTLRLKEEVINAVNEGRCLIYFPFATEPGAHGYMKGFYEFIESNNIPANRVVLSSCEIDVVHTHNVYCTGAGIPKGERMNVYWDLEPIMRNFALSATLKPVYKKFGYLNRNSESRYGHYIGCKIFSNQELYEETVMTGFLSDPYGQNADITFEDLLGRITSIQKHYPAEKKLSKTQIEEYFKALPLTPFGNLNAVGLLHNTHFLHTFSDIAIIRETSNGLTRFISEKTIKTMLSKKPFFMVGDPEILSAIRSAGFKTFSKWWDESYDNIVDPPTRFDAMLEQVEKVRKMPQAEYNKMMIEIKEVTDHNFDILLKKSHYKTFQLGETHEQRW